MSVKEVQGLLRFTRLPQFSPCNYPINLALNDKLNAQPYVENSAGGLCQQPANQVIVYTRLVRELGDAGAAMHPTEDVPVELLRCDRMEWNRTD